MRKIANNFHENVLNDFKMIALNENEKKIS